MPERTAIDFYAAHTRDQLACLKAATNAVAIARYLVVDPDHDARTTTPRERADAESLGLFEMYFFEMNPTYAGYFTRERGHSDAVSAMAALDRMGEPRSKWCRKCALYHGPVAYFTVDAPTSVIAPTALDAYWDGVEQACDEEAGTDRHTDPMAFGRWRLFDGMYGYRGHCDHARTAYTIARRHLAQTYGEDAAAREAVANGGLDLWQHEQDTFCGIDLDLDLLNDDIAQGGPMQPITRDQYIAVDPATGLSLEDLVKATKRVLDVAELIPEITAEITTAAAAATAVNKDDLTPRDVLDIVATSMTAVGGRLTPPQPFPGAILIGSSTYAKDKTVLVWQDPNATPPVNRFFVEGTEVAGPSPA